METIIKKIENLRQEIGKIIVGQDEIIDGLLIGLLVPGGHILLEGVPGTAKTLMVKILAFGVDSSFKRVQFTPDVLPSDIIGTTVYNFQSGTFNVKKGPIFTNFFLADEINRTPPKTQSALLEAMAEGQVTIDGDTQGLAQPFMVVATQNPLEYEGTFPLPEAQLDRFFLKLLVDYPSKEEEVEMLKRIIAGGIPNDFSSYGVEKVITGQELLEMRQAVLTVTVSTEIISYAQEIVSSTRKHRNLQVGASPRGSIALLTAARATAFMHGRNYVIPDDVKNVTKPVLRHRLILRPEAELEGLTVDKVLTGILDAVPVPR